MSTQSPVKRNVYLALAVLLGAMLGFLLHTLILLWVGRGGVAEGTAVTIGRWLFILLGTALGLPLGQTWWHLVYVEKRRGVFRKVK